MDLDFNDSNTIKNVFKACGAIYFILTATTYLILRRRGVNVDLRKNKYKIGMAFMPIFLVPAWLSDISFTGKVITTILLIAVGISSIYTKHISGRVFRKQFNIETEEDVRESGAEEKEEREKEEKKKARDRIKYGEQGPHSIVVFLRKNFRLSIVMIALSVGFMYGIKYPLNIVLSLLVLFPLFLIYLKQRDNEGK